MSLNEAQTKALAEALLESLEVVLYAYHKDIVVTDDIVGRLQSVAVNARELLQRR